MDILFLYFPQLLPRRRRSAARALLFLTLALALAPALALADDDDTFSVADNNAPTNQNNLPPSSNPPAVERASQHLILNATELVRPLPPPFRGALERIAERGILRFALPLREYPPFFFIDNNGQLAGYDIDLASGIAAGLKLPYEFVREYDDWDHTIKVIAEGKADIGIGAISYSLERAQAVSYTNPSFHQGVGFLVNAEQARALELNFENPEEFNRPDVAITVLGAASYNMQVAQRWYKAVRMPDASITGRTNLVLSGEALALYSDECELRILYNQQPPSARARLKLWIFDNMSDRFSLVVNHRDRDLMQYINTFLNMRGPALSVDEVFAKYLTPTPHKENSDAH